MLCCLVALWVAHGTVFAQQDALDRIDALQTLSEKDNAEALKQLENIVSNSDTVCIHSDSPNALAMLGALKPYCSNLRPAPPAQT